MKPGRNDPCPCGSGRKFKKCCSVATPGVATPGVATPGVPPGDAAALYHSGNALHDRGDFRGAVEHYRLAVKIDPRMAEAHNNLGDVLLEIGQPEAALRCFRSALSLRPDYAAAHGNLGNALKDLGRPDEAVASYRRMLELAPDVAEAHNNLGNTLLSMGRLDEAVVSYRRVVDLRPDSAPGHANLGNALRGLGSAAESAACCRRAVVLDPDFTDAYRFLGNALFDLGLFDEAAASYRRALASDPGHAEAHLALCVVLRQMGRADEAEACCRRALELQPDSAATLTLLGEIEAGKGRFAVADGLFRRAIVLDPDLPEAWAAIPRYRKMSETEPGWLTAARRLAAKPLTIGQGINLRFAIGKYLDDVGDFAEAFASYRAGNELGKRYGVRYERRRLTDRVDALIASQTAEWLGEMRDAGDPSARPVLIVGMPRSGTSLAEQILASHPDVFGAGELRYWHAAAADHARSTLSGAPETRLPSGMARGYLQVLAGLDPGALRVIDKMPANALNLGLIHAALPHARIIHMQRDPRDTGLSIYFQVFSTAHAYANDLDDIAHYHGEISRIMEHWRSVLPATSMLEVSYEALVQDIETWSRRMLDFIGLPWDPRCLDFHRTERTVMTASAWQVRQKINTTSAGRWRNYEQYLGPLQTLCGRPS